MESERIERTNGPGPERLRRVREVLKRHVRTKSTPGAVGLVVGGSGEVACWTAGRHTYEADSPKVRKDDMYDLASLTKVVATTSICMALEPQLDLDERVDRYVPAFQGHGKDRVTMRHLLAHCAGLPAHQRFFETSRGRNAVLSAACGTPLAYLPGTRTIYSDLSFPLLGAAVEHVGGASLEELARRYVLGPAGMEETMYLPGPELLGRIPPTEFQAEQRRGLIHGQVHDGNAWAMGGVAPHAGLFGAAADLGRFLTGDPERGETRGNPGVFRGCHPRIHVAGGIGARQYPRARVGYGIGGGEFSGPALFGPVFRAYRIHGDVRLGGPRTGRRRGTSDQQGASYPRE